MRMALTDRRAVGRSEIIMELQPEMLMDTPVYTPRGQHLILTLSGCTAPILDDQPCLEALVRRAAEATGATVLSIQAHRFEPHGVTVLALLAESHMSLHSYPEAGLVFVDCFTCGACDPRRSVPVLTAALRPAAVREELIERAG
jgi:S-adenosylmethionine decarboxylase proenzyme